MSVLVKYSDVAIGAKESFNISTGEKLDASNIDLIKTDGASFKRYDIPFALNSMILDGEGEFLPESGLAEIGFISKQLSDENGNFALNPSVEKQLITNELHDLILENKRVGIITSDNDMSGARISTISCLKVENFEDVLNGKLEPIWYESFSIGSEYSDGSYKDSYDYNSGLVSIKTKD